MLALSPCCSLRLHANPLLLRALTPGEFALQIGQQAPPLRHKSPPAPFCSGRGFLALWNSWSRRMRRSMSARRPASSAYRERSIRASRRRTDLSTRTVESCIDPIRALGWVSSTTGVIGVPRLFVLSQRESAATGSLTCSLGDRPLPSRIGKRVPCGLPYLSICWAIHSSPRI